MSLLMDALRKAEEAKKQAEQEKTGEDTVSQQAVVAAKEDAADSVSADPVKPASPDLSVMLEFDSEPVERDVEAESSSISDALDKAIETVSLSLDAAATIRPAVSESVDSAKEGDSDDIESFFNAQDISIESATLNEPAAIESPVERKQSLDDRQVAKAVETNEKAPIDYSVESSQPVSELEARKEPELERSKPTENQRLAPTSSISERTAKGRQSARSVFAAKNINSQNKKAYLYGGGGIALVVILAGGYFLLASSSSNTGFTIPQDTYVTSSSPLTLEGNSGSIDRVTPDSIDTQLVQDVGSNSPLVLAIDTPETTGGLVQQTEVGTAQEQLVENNQPAPTGLGITSALVSSPALTPESSNSVDPMPPLEESGGTLVASQTTAPRSISSDGDAQTAEPEATASTMNSNVDNSTDESELDLISFRKKESTYVISPQLSRAYSAYQAGNFDSALGLYNQVLSSEPRNIDALLGKAAISSAQGNTAQAMSLYSTVLTLNPSQAIARSGLLSLVPTGNPSDQERQLRNLIGDFPNVAPLAFALGNFYASQSRWIDAQKTYFNALSLAKSGSSAGTQVSPDYAFNLAVSLDRLNQPGPATTYYEEALALASQYPANFDTEIARVRINKLSGTSTP